MARGRRDLGLERQWREWMAVWRASELSVREFCQRRGLQVAHGVSERHACHVLRIPRASHRYQSIRDERADLRIRLRDLVGSRIRYGYRRLCTLLRREGW